MDHELHISRLGIYMKALFKDTFTTILSCRPIKLNVRYHKDTMQDESCQERLGNLIRISRKSKQPSRLAANNDDERPAKESIRLLNFLPN